jgi:hypothetical protein
VLGGRAGHLVNRGLDVRPRGMLACQKFSGALLGVSETGDRPAAHAVAERVGAGIGCPLARIASIQPCMASMPSVIASSITAPSDMQPGRSGNSIRKPPPSFSASGRTVSDKAHLDHAGEAAFHHTVMARLDRGIMPSGGLGAQVPTLRIRLGCNRDCPRSGELSPKRGDESWKSFLKSATLPACALDDVVAGRRHDRLPNEPDGASSPGAGGNEPVTPSSLAEPRPCQTTPAPPELSAFWLEPAR